MSTENKAGVCALQYEACQEALKVLEGTPDAQGRKLQVHKVQLPPNLFLSQEEASALVVRSHIWSQESQSHPGRIPIWSVGHHTGEEEAHDHKVHPPTKAVPELGLRL